MIGSLEKGVGVSGSGQGSGDSSGDSSGEGSGEGSGEDSGKIVMLLMVRVTVLLVSFSSWLLLLALHVNALLATWMMPSDVLLSVGVKVAE